MLMSGEQARRFNADIEAILSQEGLDERSKMERIGELVRRIPLFPDELEETDSRQCECSMADVIIRLKQYEKDIAQAGGYVARSFSVPDAPWPGVGHSKSVTGTLRIGIDTINLSNIPIDILICFLDIYRSIRHEHPTDTAASAQRDSRKVNGSLYMLQTETESLSLCDVTIKRAIRNLQSRASDRPRPHWSAYHHPHSSGDRPSHRPTAYSESAAFRRVLDLLDTVDRQSARGIVQRLYADIVEETTRASYGNQAAQAALANQMRFFVHRRHACQEQQEPGSEPDQQPRSSTGKPPKDGDDPFFEDKGHDRDSPPGPKQ